MGLLDRFRGATDDRVAVLGVSGLPFSLATERLDLVSELAAADRAVPIESVMPPDETACWPALMAGQNPGKTGVFGLIDREVGSYETYVPQGGDVQAKRLWDHAEAAEKAATVLNVPVTNPPQKEVKRMAAGAQAPDVDKAAHPPELRQYLQDSDYRLDVDAALGQDGDLEGLIADARETVKARFAAFERYLGQADWDLFVGCVTAPDRVHHFTWDARGASDSVGEALDGFYADLDERLTAFREQLPEDTTLVIVGDHGFTDLDHEVDCNRWLAREGWLEWAAEEPTGLVDLDPATRAYAFPQGRFYLNRTGREPAGSIDADEADALLDELAADLRSLTATDGSPVIDRVHRGRELYDGPHVDLAPDLVAVPEPGYDLTTSFDGPGEVFRRGPRVGMHTPGDAPLAVDQPDVDLEEAEPYDLAPTVLRLLGVDYDGIDGQSLV